MQKDSSGPSYQIVWAFGAIGLFVVLLYWVVLTGNSRPTTSVPPKPAPDGASQLIAKCGKPDRDVIIPAKLPKVPERRWLFYKSRNISAAFDRAPQPGRAEWKNVRYFDHVSKRQLNPQQVAKRFPCAVTTSASANSENRK